MAVGLAMSGNGGSCESIAALAGRRGRGSSASADRADHEGRVGVEIDFDLGGGAGAPVRACLATARQEGLITANPASEAVLPRWQESEVSEEEDLRAMTREELEMFLRVVHPGWRVYFRFLAVYGAPLGRGCRRSVVGPHPGRVKPFGVRQAGSGSSAEGERACDLQGSQEQVRPPRRSSASRSRPRAPFEPRRRPRRCALFSTVKGTPLRHENVRRRVLLPAAEEAGVRVDRLPYVPPHLRVDAVRPGENATRFNAGSGTTPRASPSTPTRISWTTGLADALDLDTELKVRQAACGEQ